MDATTRVPDIVWSVSEEAARLHADALVWDSHGCLPMDVHRNAQFIGKLRQYRQAGVDFASINIGYGNIPPEQHVSLAGTMRDWIRDHEDEYVLTAAVADVDRARAEGKLAIAFDVEGARAVQDDLDLIERFYDLGVRWMLIAYNRTNAVGGGCHDDDTGLSDLGREVLDEMARVGMVVCCSHTGYRTALEVCEYNRYPVILSHSNPRALRDHARNVPDEVMRAVADTGGVIGINGIGIFLGDNDIRTETMARHIDYAVELVGPEHVGIGTDYVFDPVELGQDLDRMPAYFPPGHGYEGGVDVVGLHQLPELTHWMLGHGYPENAIRGILGENFRRIAARVWK